MLLLRPLLWALSLALVVANTLRLAHPAIRLSATITSPPAPSLVHARLRPRQATSKGRDACSALYSVYNWCSTSGFTNLQGPSLLASCACYYSSSWVPRIFDGLATSCYDWIRSTRPDATAGVAQYLNVCYIAGDISKSQSSGSLACNTLAKVLTSCAAVTKSDSYTFSGSSSLANCACYSSSSYNPYGFDDLASRCYTYAQNLAGQGGQISTLTNFCNDMGDIRLTASKALEECDKFDRQYSACEAGYNGDFKSLDKSLQASCLCYAGVKTLWVPGAIDGAVESCLGYISTADTKRARKMMGYGGGFCEGFGDMRKSSSTSSTRSTRATTSTSLEITTSAEPASTTSLIPRTTSTESSSTPVTRLQSTAGSTTSLPIPSGTGESGSNKLIMPNILLSLFAPIILLAFQL